MKVLIYMQEGILAKTGGPVGYNYALKSQLDKMHVDFIDYIPGGNVYKPSIGKRISNKWYGKVIKTIRDVIKWSSLLYGHKKCLVDISKYDIVHFHGCDSMYQIRRSLKDYKGKVVLTSHQPEVSSKEMLRYLTPWAQKHMNWFYKNLIRIDRYAFNRADYIVFPCREAEEPYYHTWPEFESIKKRKGSCFKYVLTGTYECKPKKSRSEIFSTYGIPEDAFVVSYVGRHNEIKGYDQLKEIGCEVLANIPNCYFLIAGEETPLKGLKNNRWIEVGWTNDPHSIIASSDVFVLPNKETYFDLIMLEVLSLGSIVVASNTGGNKYFHNRSEGINIYNTREEAIAQVVDLYNTDRKKREHMKEENLSLYKQSFSLDVFAQNYIKLYESL